MADTRLFPLPGARADDPAVDRWFASQPAALASIVERWFDEMRQCGPDVRVLLHDGHPTACVGELAFAYVNAFTHHVNVGFFLGAQLEDPTRLLQGTGRYMRHVRITPNEVVDETSVRALVRRAYADMLALGNAARGATPSGHG